MLVDERKMDAQSAGFLTVEASGGLGFHILGAAARLGFRGLALVNQESERSTLSQHTGEVIIDTAEGAALAEAVKSPVESGFFFVTAALTEARPLEVSETKTLLRWRQELATKMSRGVLILHESEDEKIWHDWHQSYPEDWIFLTPQLVGLRDASFLDHWVQLTEQSFVLIAQHLCNQCRGPRIGVGAIASCCDKVKVPFNRRGWVFGCP
jgi:hypothetical protein